MRLIEYLLLAGMIGGSFTLGFLIRDTYNDYRILDGLHLSNVSSWEEAVQTSQSLDSKGNWVCVNVNDMTYKHALEVCSHEVGHEIFAKECESNPELCFDLVDTLKQTGGNNGSN